MQLDINDIKPISSKKDNLNRLEYWLNYELSGAGLYILGSFYWSSLFMSALAGLAALLFIPLLFNVLIERKRYGWLISFFVFIIVPPLVISFLAADSTWTQVSVLTAIALFFFYCGFLRLIIPGWKDPEDNSVALERVKSK